MKKFIEMHGKSLEGLYQLGEQIKDVHPEVMGSYEEFCVAMYRLEVERIQGMSINRGGERLTAPLQTEFKWGK